MLGAVQSGFLFLAERLSVVAHPAYVVLLFFAYSTLGYVMECIVLSIEKKRVVLDRGFASHLPFCIIYGFGAMAGYAMLCPFSDNWILLFLAGAVGATGFEYITAQVQVRIFGDFWWDYTKKPFNYKGVLCLESTLGWGVLAIVVVRFFHKGFAGVISLIPLYVAIPLAVLFLSAYVIDFAMSAYSAREKVGEPEEARTAFLQMPGEETGMEPQ